MADVTPAEWKGSKVRTGCAPLLLLGIAMLAAMGSLGCKGSSRASPAPGKDAHAQQVKAVMHLEPFVVNLADAEDNRFLRVGVDLGLESQLSGKGGKGEEGEVPTAPIRDCILTVLSTWHSDALLAPDGKQKLKDDLVRALRGRVPELGVREVYFTDFLVQR